MKTVATALATWSACRAAKWYLDRSSRRDTVYLGDRVRLRTLWNRGAAFGLPIRKEWLPAISVGALAVLLTQRRSHPLATGLILGGGASNLRERLGEGRVYDYIQFPKAPGRMKHYVYNLADFAIFLGGFALFLPGRKRR